MFSLFSRKTEVKPDGTTGQPEGEVSPLVIHDREPLMRPGRMTRQDEAKIYHASPSIIDYLPWVEFLDEEECLLLEDGISVGAVYDVTPVATEGRTNDRLEQIRDTVEDALQDSFDEYDENPWVVQFFCQDEDDAEAYLDHLRGYVKPHAQRTVFTEAWLGEMARHIRSISRPEGLFTDALITGQPWRGQQRRTRMVIYRWLGKSASRKPGSGVSLPPFADAHKLVEEGLAAHAVDESDLPDIDADSDGEGEDEDKRDILGEMEISARMMITGGDPKEEAEMKRADRAMIREALLMAAHATYKVGRQMLPSDLQKALYSIAGDDSDEGQNVRNAQRKAKAAEMAESLGMFTQEGSFEAELFNREGELWPEADVTLVDLGHLAREGYEAQMALTMVSMTNMINNIAERDQYLGRDIVFAVDEAHIVTVNPLLSP